MFGDLSYYPEVKNCYWDANTISYNSSGTKGMLENDPMNCAKFDEDFILNKTVNTGTLMSNSLIKVLNALADSSLVEVYSKWMFSSEKFSVKFTINNDKVFYEDSQLILFPTLEPGG